VTISKAGKTRHKAEQKTSKNIKQSAKVHPKNALNTLPGNRWLYFTRSILKTDYEKSIGFQLREAHGANKPPQLMRELIEFFTKKGELVLDPFAGVGGTLLGASLCRRKAIGIEINKEWVSIYKKVCKTENLSLHHVHVGDCIGIMEKLEKQWERRFHLVLTDPPYGPNLDKTMCNGKYSNRNRVTRFNKFSVHEKDFTNSKSLEEYFQRMRRFFKNSSNVLKNNRYLVLMARNCYQNGEYIMITAHLTETARKEGFTLKGEIIWHQNGTRLRPYGYPFVFVPNIIHHNILIFRKEVNK